MRQTFQGWEMCIVDDGSEQDVAGYLQGITDPRIQWVRNETPVGPAAARNQGILATRGEFVAFLDADDEWEANKLEAQMPSIRDDSKVALSYTNYSKRLGEQPPQSNVLEKYAHVCEGQVFEELLKENFINTSSVIVRRPFVAKSGLFDAQLRYAEDYDLWLRLSRVGEFRYVPLDLCLYRFHDANSVLSYGYATKLAPMLELVIAKHSDFEPARRYFRKQLGKAWMTRAWAAWEADEFICARSAFLKAAKYGHRSRQATFRVLCAVLPEVLLKRIVHFARGRRQRREPQAQFDNGRP